MRIDFFAGKDAKGNPLVRPFYVTQEIAESIIPASAEVLRTYAGPGDVCGAESLAAAIEFSG